MEDNNISPRQKMINLMYVVLMVMLALNVSSGVLDGFTMIDKTLSKTNSNTMRENNIIYTELQKMAASNPQKASKCYNQSLDLKNKSDSIFTLCEQLKSEILIEADGKYFDPDNIVHQDNLEAASRVMLGNNNRKGILLKNAIDAYRNVVISTLSDSTKRNVMKELLSTKVQTKDNKSWEEQMFESMPVVAAIAMLTKLQTDVRYAEGEVLHELHNAVDKKDIRVNNIQAFVVPESRVIISGNELKAQVMMAAVDTTNVPDIYIGQSKIKNGRINIRCNTPGNHTLNGYISTIDNDGNRIKKGFTLPYTVIKPSVTISADMMNIMYAGYDNPLSVGVPGIPNNALSVTAQGATIRRVVDGKYIVRPATVGKDVAITVQAKINNKDVPMGTMVFNTRKIPDPAPYISYVDAKGHENRYRGGAVQRAVILETQQLKAAVDDGLLDIAFKVKSFDIILLDAIGNVTPISSDSSRFSQKQQDAISKMRRNSRFFITNIRATGPDGIERKLNTSMEVLIK